MDLLFWTYLINAVICINQGIDSVYCQEWKLFCADDKIDIKGFLIVHFPILFAVFWGLVLIDKEMTSGYVISLLVAAGGIFAFLFHFYHLTMGRHEFNIWLSELMLILTLPISLFQMALTITKMM